MIDAADKSIKLIIGGDLCPIHRNEPLFIEAAASEILRDQLPVWRDADMRIVKLECPFIAAETPLRRS